MKEGQPGFDTVTPDAGACRFVYRIARRRPKGGKIPIAKGAQDAVVKKDFTHGREGGIRGRARRALRFRVECTQRFENVSEQVKSERLGGCRGKDVNYAASGRIFPSFANSAGPYVSVHTQIVCQFLLAESLSGTDREGRAAHRLYRSGPLNKRASRGDNEKWAIGSLIPRHLRQACAASRR